MNNSSNDILKNYHLQIEAALKNSIENLGPKTKLRDACEYALLSGGKRFRPILVHLVANLLDEKKDVSKAAIAIEYFHTASLIADDLPCMDDDDTRRDKPTTHKVFGESTALLASYALIAAGYELLTDNALLLENKEPVCLLAVKNVSLNTGLLGAAGGQYLDIAKDQLTALSVMEVLRLKTVTLFEISFVLGWLYGGGEIAALEQIKKAAYHFGMAFQIADDFADFEEDKKNGRLVNLVIVAGVEDAKVMLNSEIEAFKAIMRSLKLKSSILEALCDNLAV